MLFCCHLCLNAFFCISFPQKSFTFVSVSRTHFHFKQFDQESRQREYIDYHSKPTTTTNVCLKLVDLCKNNSHENQVFANIDTVLQPRTNISMLMR